MHAIHKREKNQKNIQSEPFRIEAFELELEGGGNVGVALVASKHSRMNEEEDEFSEHGAAD